MKADARHGDLVPLGLQPLCEVAPVQRTHQWDRVTAGMWCSLWLTPAKRISARNASIDGGPTRAVLASSCWGWVNSSLSWPQVTSYTQQREECNVR